VTRVRAWTGSRWSDVKVWTGTQWKSYVDYVYGAAVYSYDMNSGAQGWVQEYAAGGETPALNWSNVHLYCNDFSGSAYSNTQYLRLRGNWVVKLRPGDTMHMNASLLVQHISGYAGDGGNFTCYISYKQTGGYDAGISGTLPLGAGWFGWATIDTRSHSSGGFVVPGVVGDPPVEITIYYIEVGCNIANGAVGPFGTYRFFCDWAQLIDQNGNLLVKLTADAIPNLKAWNGSAWV
jgi:hypothetical protein